MNPVETYLRELYTIRLSGAAVKETSYYNPLANLLNEIGKTLKPQVRCIMQLKNTGAGMPDGGLFTPDQFPKSHEGQKASPQNPSRGVIEVKGTSDDTLVTASGKQVTGYWNKYRQVLVTNYRDFVLVGQDANGNPIKLETFRLDKTEAEFWANAANPHKMAEEYGERLIEYLKRVMLLSAALTAPRDVAWFLASYARDARLRIEQAVKAANSANSVAALNSLRDSMQKTLGISFEGEKGEYFFRSTLVQTLFYGVFSAWVLWAKSGEEGSFDWRVTGYYQHLPVMRALLGELTMASNTKSLDLVEVLNWTGNALNRIDRNSFFVKFDDSQAVQYFYEPFLEAYDPVLRKELGVWYTPPEIVKYMVARVDTVLREELGIEDGLADENVYVLDPCCGTGAYLVEVLNHISTSLQDKGLGVLAAQRVNRAARERIFGFEILPAPFVVAHLQLGLLLQNLKAPLNENERAGVYLTNALTGWNIVSTSMGQARQGSVDDFEEELKASNVVKQEKPILVVLGNPPYNAFAGISPEGEMGLVEPYKEGLIKDWGIKKFNLDDLYVRFFRLAERAIAEMQPTRGVVSFISNHSWVSDPSFVVLRQHLYESFDKFWIENMHGNRKISEYAPDGKTSETIFAIPGFSEGIQQGVAISLWVKTGKPNTETQVFFRDDLHAAKAVERRAQLIASLEDINFEQHYTPANPTQANRYSFRPSDVSVAYEEWPKLTDLCKETPSNGLMEKRGGALISIDKNALETRMKMYFDPTVSWETLKMLGTNLTEDASGYDAKSVRPKILKVERYKSDRLHRYAIRPFETRWCYYSDVSPLWNRSRPTLWAQCWEGNTFLLSRFNPAKQPEGSPFYLVTGLSDDHFLTPDAVCFPVRLKKLPSKNPNSAQSSMFEEEESPKANLSDKARAYLSSLGLVNPDADAESAGQIWMHSLAVGYSPAYLQENADGIRQDWPRIPLPNSAETLKTSATLGNKIAALLDTEKGVGGVTSGAIRSELKVIGVLTSLTPDSLNLAVTAGWGHGGKEGVTMPGKGRYTQREYTAAELAAIETGAFALGITLTQLTALLGETTYDIYLNEATYWKNVPLRVWEYYIGGYQVIKKWLSYREQSLLGRPLKDTEAAEVMNTARRLCAILLLEPALDANYRAAAQNSYEWPSVG